MKLIINGGRDFENYELAKQEFDKVFEHYNILEIVMVAEVVGVVIK